MAINPVDIVVRLAKWKYCYNFQTCAVETSHTTFLWRKSWVAWGAQRRHYGQCVTPRNVGTLGGGNQYKALRFLRPFKARNRSGWKNTETTSELASSRSWQSLCWSRNATHLYIQNVHHCVKNKHWTLFWSSWNLTTHCFLKSYFNIIAPRICPRSGLFP